MNKTRKSERTIKEQIREIVENSEKEKNPLIQKDIIIKYNRSTMEGDYNEYEEYLKKQSHFSKLMGEMYDEKILDCRSGYYYINTLNVDKKAHREICENIRFTDKRIFVVSLMSYEQEKIDDITVAVKVLPEDIHQAMHLFKKYYGDKYYGAFEQNGMLMLMLKDKTDENQPLLADLIDLVNNAYKHSLKRKKKLKKKEEKAEQADEKEQANEIEPENENTKEPENTEETSKEEQHEENKESN